MMCKFIIIESSKGKPILQKVVTEFHSYIERTWIICTFKLEVWNQTFEV